MRIWYRLACLLVLALTVLTLTSFGQDNGNNNNNGSQSNNSGPITVEGCVGSMNGHFGIVTDGGVYRLKGDHDLLMNHNGKQVRVTGNIISLNKTGRQTIEVTNLKKLHDFCQH